MTTDTDKLVEMAQAAGIGTVGGQPTAYPAGYTKLAAFRAAIIADLCGDVEPVAEFGGRRQTPEGTTEFWGVLLEPWDAPPKGSQLYSASTVAALKARVAELEKDAARLEFVCNSPNRMVERESGLWRVYEDVAPADHPTAVWQGMTPRWHVTPREAIDAAITAALTKGQP